MGRSVFVLGGARSGKSKFALDLAKKSRSNVTFVATLEVGDTEMADRVEAHWRQRPAEWQTIEVAQRVGETIRDRGLRGTVVVDCLSLLVSNLLLRALDDPPGGQSVGLEPEIESEIRAVFDSANDLDLLVVVSNEVGHGVVPPTPLGRSYRDLLGFANQLAAAQAHSVYWMVAGNTPTDQGHRSRSR